MASAPESPPDREVVLKVVILMPFEWADPARNRLFKLIYRRLKYIIEGGFRQEGPLVVDGRAYRFEVDVFLSVAGDIPRDALQAIRDCDIALGFVCSLNLTVIYELAVRNLLRPELLLIVDGDAAKLLPFYMRDMGRITLRDSWVESQVMLDESRREDDVPAANFNAGPIPPLIEALSDAYDSGVADDLRRAFESILGRHFHRPPHVLGVMEQHDPERLVSRSIFYYPAGLLKYRWFARGRNPQGGHTPYTAADLSEPPSFCDWNPQFLDLFDLSMWDPEADGPLWRDHLYTEVLRPFVAPSDLVLFNEDQQRLERDVVYGPRVGLARVPLRIGDQHPDPSYTRRSFLPCFVMKKAVGSPQMMHNLYVLVLFFDVTGAADDSAYRFAAPMGS